MMIHVDESWRIKSDVRSWQIEELQGKSRKVWRPVAWVITLERARRYLLRYGVCPSAFAAVEETWECRDPFDPDGKRGFCWQFDEVFPAGSPDARFPAGMIIPTRRDEEVLEPDRVGKPEIGEKTHRDDDKRLESGAGDRLLMPVGDQWWIREGTLEWHVERYRCIDDSKRSNWKPEAYCVNLLDAMNTLLQRRVWLIEGDNPQTIIAERETIRQEILSAWRTFGIVTEAA